MRAIRAGKPHHSALLLLVSSLPFSAPAGEGGSWRGGGDHGSKQRRGKRGAILIAADPGRRARFSLVNNSIGYG